MILAALLTNILHTLTISFLVLLSELLVIIDRQVSLEKYAWEGKVLYQAASVEQKTAFAKYYLDHFDEQGQTMYDSQLAH